jgi:hypothetical protein
MKGMRLFVLLSLSLVATSCAAYKAHKEAEALENELEQLTKPIEQKPLSAIDLSRIGHIAPKGRVQDQEYNQLEVVDQLLMHGAASIPYLIGKLDDETEIKPPVMDYWSRVTVGDVALVILTDFMTNPAGKVNPGFSWEELFGSKKDPNISAEQYLRTQLASHDRRWLRQKWERIWANNLLFWDDLDRYFVLA